MNLFSIGELKTLTEKPEGACVSIFMPTHRMSTETLQNPIRFKNLVRQAEELLVNGGLRGQDARDLLEPALHPSFQCYFRKVNEGLQALDVP
ncbi:MAG: hypothetical protein LDL41_09585 [Coleofasciculus sp. S288]|nr:hypothetical protein [Coleofasciculus sp. S288]